MPPTWRDSADARDDRDNAVRYVGPERRSPIPPAGLDLSNLPTWAKAISLLGFPIFVALFFMAQFAGFIPSPSARIEPLVQHYIAAGEAERSVMKAQFDALSLKVVSLNKTLTQVCRNTAKSEFQAAACD